MSFLCFFLTGEVESGPQQHFAMETQACLCVPTEDVLNVYPTTQWIDGIQQAITNALGIPETKVLCYKSFYVKTV